MPKIEINGHRLYYIERGKGPAILFIHPPVLTSLNFLYQLQGLSDVARSLLISGVMAEANRLPSRLHTR